MLTKDKLSILRREQLRDILKDFSLQLGPGDKAVLIGEEGNGKSTLLKLIHDPDSVEGYAEWSGSVSPGGRTGYLPQELGARRLSEPARLLFERSPGFAALTPRQRHALAAELGLDAAMFASERPLRSFSGGERVKLQLAVLAAEEPELYLLDEPSNDLDLESLEWLEDFILSRREPVLFVSHDETLIEAAANMVIHMERIRRKTLCRCSVVHLSYREYVQRREENMDSQKRQAQNERREEKKRREKFQKLQQQVESDLRNVSRQDPHGGYLLKKKMKAVKSLEHRYERERGEMTEMPETEEAGSWPAGMKQLYFYDSLDRIPPDALRKARAERVFLQSGNTARIDTPRYVALWGVLGGREHRIGALRVESPAGEEFSVSAVSLPENLPAMMVSASV